MQQEIIPTLEVAMMFDLVCSCLDQAFNYEVPPGLYRQALDKHLPFFDHVEDVSIMVSNMLSNRLRSKQEVIDIPV